MGRAKDMMMEREDNPYMDIPDKYVSGHLFHNKLIRDYVLTKGFDGVCSYCNDETKVLPLKSVVKMIDSIIMKYYGDPDNEGVGWDSSFEGDVPGFHSEAGGYILPNNRYYYDNMRDFLLGTGFETQNEILFSDIVEGLSHHMHLVDKDPYGENEAEERWIDWRIIKEKAMKMAKDGLSLEEMVKAEAARLDYLKSDIYVAQTPLQVEKILTLYRTVNYNTKRKPLLFRDLTSPPVKYTRDLRMSAKGDSVFYGSLDKETTLREAIKDQNDAYTYVGKFQTKHPLRLLDLTGIRGSITIYDQKQYYLLSFLRIFCEEVSEFIPDHDAIRYAPTQLITYYFRHKLRHYDKNENNYPIDGILFTSSKNGAINVVLFYDNKNSEKHLELIEWDLVFRGNNQHHVYPKSMKYIETVFDLVRRIWMKS